MTVIRRAELHVGVGRLEAEGAAVERYERLSVLIDGDAVPLAHGRRCSRSSDARRRTVGQQHLRRVSAATSCLQREELPEPEAFVDDLPELDVPLAAFVTLPTTQRSAVILKDVLGLSLEETAAPMNSSVPAVKSALTRGRANLERVGRADHGPLDPRVRRYAELFNARDWDALRALLSEEARLELVSRSRREGRAVREYFGRYAEVAPAEALRAEAGFVDGAPVVAMWRGEVLAYFVRLGWLDGEIVDVRDSYFVPYIALEAHFSGA
ncbi:MAG: hypothetical protein DI536_33615 [Archangium gephyra]|uniref:RNA polymerase sigma factor 70 region 4 type 2 domain-containing protein n=1 Tax=Archangium gephyra TaxID=48 RepID=A0A2W5SPD0_9BACT|nr:MAG: hypothetical protein DI536_33615 [Archangium gephyra]